MGEFPHLGEEPNLKTKAYIHTDKGQAKLCKCYIL